MRRLLLFLIVLTCLLGLTWWHFASTSTQLSSVSAHPPAEPIPVQNPVEPETMWVKFPAPQSSADKRSDYAIELLQRILQLTTPDYGPYKFSLVQNMSRERQYTELKRNNLVTVIDSPASREWEQSLAPIVFPTRRGLQNYRLLLIDQSKQPRFSSIRSIEGLKALRAGVNTHWLLRSILEEARFTIVQGNDYEGLFQMLIHDRFDYFPRALNEIYEELNTHSAALPSLAIETTLALHIPSPTYFYVSATNKRMHKRISEGIWKLYNSGEFMQIYNRYFNEQQLRDALQERRIFHVDNPYLTDHPIFHRPEFWFKP